MESKRYHTLEILDLITKQPMLTDLTLVSATYDVGGLTAVVEDQYNKQRYEIKINPIREEQKQ